MARVLLVDDDPAIREATALRLQVDGHHVIAVGDADAALVAAAASAASGPPLDVAVLDVDAPGVNDVALLALLRTHHVTAALPVVFYTGNPGAAAVHGLSLADSNLTSGHPLTRLLATIASLSPTGGDDSDLPSPGPGMSSGHR
jgi:CheY-like chemotaxis protein